MFSTTEITSSEILSDNPIHQRLFSAYVHAGEFVGGNLLEIGCGVGRGLSILLEKSAQYTAIDKNEALIADLTSKFPRGKFISQNIPPLTGLPDNFFDFVVTFQVIEHIEDDKLFLKEIHRVLKKGGKAIITTPNIKLSLTRNPWHTREYTATELKNLVLESFERVETKGISGSEKVMKYHEQNRQSVAKYKKWDIFNLEKHLPRQILAIPYDILNRLNRKKLAEASGIAAEITDKDYLLGNEVENCLDFFYIATK